MRVMEIISGADINGAVVHCLTLSRELQCRGHHVQVLCLPDSWIGGQLDPPMVLHSSLQRWPLDELRRVAGLVRQHRIDVVHTHQSRAHTFGVMLRWMHGIPSVATAHNRRIQLHWALNSQVVGVSHMTTRYHRRFNLVPRSRIHTVHNFVDYERYESLDLGARSSLRQEWGVGEDELLLGVVGVINRKKGLCHLMEALAAVRRQCPHVKLVVVGIGCRNELYQQQLRARVEGLGLQESVIWAGQRTDMPAVLSALDVHVVASLEENFPINLLEAMAAGRPVVATRVGGVPECVADRLTGTLVPPGDSEALARAITALVRSAALRRQMGAAARRRVRESFSPDSQIPLLERVLQSAAGERRPRRAA